MVSPGNETYNELIYIGVGTNLGDRLGHIRMAKKELISHGIEVIRTASVYETQPWGFESEDLFFNTVFECRSSMGPLDCLKTLQFVEKKIGRSRTPGSGYESRIIDLDILLFKDQQITLPELTVPHPYISERQFVIIPMNELTGSFPFGSLRTTFSELKNKSEDAKNPFVVHYPPLINE